MEKLPVDINEYNAFCMNINNFFFLWLLKIILVFLNVIKLGFLIIINEMRNIVIISYSEI